MVSEPSLTMRFAAIGLDLAKHTRPGERATGPGEVQALILDSATSRLVLVSADAIWFDDATAAQLRREIAERCGCLPASVCLAATHTHGSPQPESGFTIGPPAPEFAADLGAAVRQAVAQALAGPAERASLALAQAPIEKGLIVNRRRIAWYFGDRRPTRRAQNLPNPTRAVDERVTALVLFDRSGRPRCVIVHFACHPVADPAGTRGADFPGAMRAVIARRLGAEPGVMFLQGFCGDVRPYLRHQPTGLKDWVIEGIVGARFRRARVGDAERLGIALADAIIAALDRARPAGEGGLAAVSAELPLLGASGAALGRSLQLTAWRIGDCRLVFANGEMLSGLAPDDGVLSVGYANGMVGYVAPESEYAVGGYEIDGFLARFGLSERLAPATGAAYLARRAALLSMDGPHDVAAMPKQGLVA